MLVHAAPLAGSALPGASCNLAGRLAAPAAGYGVPMARHPYLVAYDVACPRRLARTLAAVKAWRASGQKSVAECFLSPAERDGLCRALSGIIESAEDRLHVIRLDPRMQPECFGVARHQGAGHFLVV